MKHEFKRNPRKERATKKNYVPAILLSVLFWMLLMLLVFFVDPALIENFIFEGFYLVFFGLLFLAMFFSASLLLLSSRRGALLSLSVCVVLFLRLKSLGNIINMGLLVIFAGLLEIYWSKYSPKTTLK